MRDGKKMKDASVILSMSRVQSHRGPDDAGHVGINCRSGGIENLAVNGDSAFDASADLFFGFRRLSILDLSANGHQPMMSPNEDVVLMLNGEIYNAFDFVPELKCRGSRFRGQSDTEIVLQLYLVYGLDGMMARLNGMFAIAIYDTRIGKLFLARDRCGVKPLYIYEDQRYFAFSSELKSFGYLPAVRFALEESELSEFLMFRYNRERTLLKNIRQLKPGHLITYCPGSGIGAETPYDTQNALDSIDSPEALEFFLEKSVRSQLISDVPLGCQLSGGVDSSLIAHFAAQSAGSEFHTVSVVFDDQQYSEERFIEHVEHTVGVIGHHFKLSPDYYEQALESASWHLEQPISHPNTIGVMLLSERARKFVTVLLSGEGADELLAGYSRFLGMMNPWGRPLLSRLRSATDNRLQEVMAYRDVAWRAVTATRVSLSGLARKLFHDLDEFAAIEPRLDVFRATTGSTLERQRRYEMATYLPDLLLRQDKMSMASSIENRVPYLDNRLVDASFTLSSDQLVARGPNGRHGKFILKQICERVFGSDFTFRTKQGFGIPLRQFMARASFQDKLNTNILPGIAKRGIFKISPIRKSVIDIQTADWAEIQLLWTMVAFESWARQFLDREFHPVENQKYCSELSV